MSKGYLVGYNLFCLVVWSVALVSGLLTWWEKRDMGRDGLIAVWSSSGFMVQVGQTAMILEIFHAGLGLVRSPIFTTGLQVSSRLWILIVATKIEEAQYTQACGLMILSWSSVEVVRYSFYLCALLMAKVPYPLFWLRYTVFYVLYPTGITGELGTAFSALPYIPAAWLGLVKFILWGYVPGSPFMYMNMVKNRKSAMKKRFMKPKPLSGCEFPISSGNTRSTSIANKKCLAAALGACGEDGVQAASRCMKEANYRFGYTKHFIQLVKLCAKSDENCVAASEAGIEWIRKHFEYFDAKGAKMSFQDAIIEGKASTTKKFVSGRVVGEDTQKKSSYLVPYDGGWHPSTPAPPTKTVKDSDLKKVIKTWVQKGVVEADAGKAIEWTSNFIASKSNDLQSVHCVLIGAGSAMGPCAKLLEHGTNVVAIDIPGVWGKGTKRPAAKLWQRLFDLAKHSPEGASLTYPKIHDPSLDETEAAGADLMRECKELADWLCETWLPSLPSNAKVCIGNYTYLDGDLHVKLAVCADALIDRLLKSAKAKNIQAACAFLCTPTDVHLIPQKCYNAALDNITTRPHRVKESFLRFLSNGKFLKPQVTDPILINAQATDPAEAHLYFCDGLSVAQGPNYALAKRIQHWRAILAFKQGHVVSSAIAPSTATLSVIHNKTFAWAYGGMPNFGFEIFKQDTTNAVMAAILIHDILNPQTPKSPQKSTQLHSTLQLFSSQSVHGGLWRSPYTVDSIGEVSALIYFMHIAQPYITAAFIIAALAIIVALLASLPSF